jgi:hypothetical protein
MSVLHEEKRRTTSDSGKTNATETVLGNFRDRSENGKSYCRTRSDVGSERVKVPEVPCCGKHFNKIDVISYVIKVNPDGKKL